MKKTLYEYYLRSLSWALNHPNAGMDIDTATINFIDKPDVMYYGTFHELLKNTELEPLLDKYYIIHDQWGPGDMDNEWTAMNVDTISKLIKQYHWKTSHAQYSHGGETREADSI